jgi:hypothetical protein
MMMVVVMVVVMVMEEEEEEEEKEVVMIANRGDVPTGRSLSPDHQTRQPPRHQRRRLRQRARKQPSPYVRF